MSKKRNQVLFTKPDDPKFLKLIKEQAGYKEGPTVDAKVFIQRFTIAIM